MTERSYLTFGLMVCAFSLVSGSDQVQAVVGCMLAFVVGLLVGRGRG